MKDKTFTGKDLEAALKDDLFESKQSDISLIGMVKKSEQKGHICFTQAGCDSWIDIPIDMIENAEHLKNSTCKDHSHPVMRISFKGSENPEHNVLIALLKQTNQANAYRSKNTNIQNQLSPQGYSPPIGYGSQEALRARTSEPTRGNYYSSKNSTNGNSQTIPMNFFASRIAGGFRNDFRANLDLISCKVYNCEWGCKLGCVIW